MQTGNINQILLNKKPIGPIGINKFKPIGEKAQTNIIVDRLLADYSDIIDDRYVKWFAKRFHALTFEQIHRAASEARQEGKNPQRLFCHKINKQYLEKQKTPEAEHTL